MEYLLLAGLGAYLLVMALLFLFQRQIMYIPFGGQPDLAEAGLAGEMQPVTLKTEDGLALLAWYRPAATADRPTLVYFHGNAGHIGMRADKVRPYLQAGWGLLLVEYRGYGGNPGRPDEPGLYADGRAALAFLDATGVPPDRLVLYGESLGGAVAVQMATEHAAGALVLEAPLSSAGAVAQARYPIFPARWLVLDKYDSLAKITAVRIPLLLVHGERDSVIPPRLARALFEAAPEPKEAVFLPDAGHNDLHEHGLAELVLDFVNRRLPRQG